MPCHHTLLKRKVKMAVSLKAKALNPTFKSETQILLDCVHSHTDPSALVWSSVHESGVDLDRSLGDGADLQSTRRHIDFAHKQFESCLSRLRRTPGSNVFPQQVLVMFQACAGTGWKDSTLGEAVRIIRTEQNRIEVFGNKNVFFFLWE